VNAAHPSVHYLDNPTLFPYIEIGGIIPYKSGEKRRAGVDTERGQLKNSSYKEMRDGKDCQCQGFEARS
jgi:hypothetical protein